jgi:hypothetical protein
MARQAEQNPTAGKINKTPAPDEVTNPRSPTGQGYGMNGPHNNASSVAPGQRVISPLGQNLETSVDDGGALDRVIREGTARVDDSIGGQLRKIADGNVPDHPAMASARSRQPTYPGPKAATLPAATAKSDAQPGRKPS